MSFAQPQMLWFLTTLAIPIIIHFFNFRKLKVVEFSTLQFIEEVENETKRKKNLKHILILLSRILFLLFLVLAFAQPQFSNTNDKFLNTAIYIDNSYSMSSEVGDAQNALESSLNIIQRYLEKSSIDQRYILITNDFDNIKTNWMYKDALSEHLTSIKLTSNKRTFNEVISRLESIQEEYQLLYFSDFQKSTIGPTTQTDRNIRVFPMEIIDQRNLYIDSLYFDNPIILFDNNNILNLSITNTGSEPSRDVQVKLLNENKLIATQTVMIDAKSNTLLEFDLDLNSIESKYLSVEVSDYPVSFDNVYRISFVRFQSPRVVQIFANLENIYIKYVYGNDDLFDYKVFSINDLEYDELENVDLLILNGFESIPEEITTLKEDCDLVIIPGSEIDPDSYGKFLNVSVDISEDTTIQNLEIPDLEDPIFADVFQESIDNKDFPKSRILLNVKSGNNILSTQFGQAFVARFIQEERSVYLMTSPLDGEFTNLPTHTIFLPLFYRIAQLSKQTDQPLAFNSDNRILTIRSEQLRNSDFLSVKGPSSDFIPNFNIQGQVATMEFPPSEMVAGYYHVLSGNDTLRTIAINHSQDESELEGLTISELNDFFNTSPNVQIMMAGAFSADTVDGILDGDTRLWKYALILALIFVLAEILLVRFL